MPNKLPPHEFNQITLTPSTFPPARLLSRRSVLYLARRLAEHFTNQQYLKPEREGSFFLLHTKVYGITIQSKIESATVMRSQCKKFWQQSLEKKVNEDRLNHEAKNAILGGPEINDGRTPQLYCSNETLERENEKRKDNEEKLSRYKVVDLKNKTEESLLSIALKNEENRISELYFIAKNFERLAGEKKFNWIFVTLTAPAKYHPNPSKGKNSYDPSVGIKGSHDYLKHSWTNIRSILNERGIPTSPDHYFGFRTVEPHKDGSLHWHLLIFVDEKYLPKVTQAIREKFPGEVQAKIVLGSKDEGCASAASYLYKYITKSLSRSKSTDSESDIDNNREQNDLASLRNKERVQAALKAIAARQYQPFGICNLGTAFRKINKLDLQNISPQSGSVLDFVKSEIWRNPNGYFNMLKNRDIFTINAEIKLIKTPIFNSYGEPIQKVIGIRIGQQDFIDDKKYRIVRS